MRTQLDDIGLHHELTGPTGAPVVALSHSLGSSSIMWEPQLAALESNYRVLRIDSRGHGDSEAPSGPYKLDALAAETAALLDALGLGPVHWVGLSMGGMIGQGLALNHGQSLASLILCDTMAVVPEADQPVWLERIATAQSHGMAALADATMERWFTAPFRDRQPATVDSIKAQFLATPLAGYLGCCEAVRRLNYLPRLAEIALPTVVLVGEFDPASAVGAADAMVERIPGAERVVIEDAAHLSNIEQAGRFNESLLDFLARHA